MSSNNLSRLLFGLKTVGVEKGERNKAVADKTGYALGTITRILSGNAALTDRFIQSVCSAFGIRKEWICEGIEPVKKAGFDVAGLETLNMPSEWQADHIADTNNFKLAPLRDSAMAVFGVVASHYPEQAFQLAHGLVLCQKEDLEKLAKIAADMSENNTKKGH